MRDVIEIGKKRAEADEELAAEGKRRKKLTATERESLVRRLTKEMQDAAKQLDFERAAYLRDQIKTIRDTK